MSSIKRQYQVFINEMIAHGDQVRAYMAAYPRATPESARVKSYTLLQNVTISAAIKQEADKIRAIATQEAITELKDEIKGKVLTATEKRELLRKIALGEIEIPAKKPAWDRVQEKFVMVPVVELPDHAARMKAIDLDNKMAGDYAPTKVAATDSKGNDIVQSMTEEELEAEIKKLGGI